MSTTPRLVPVRDEHNQIAGFRRADEPAPPAPEPAAPQPAAPAAPAAPSASAPARRSVAELLPDSAHTKPAAPPQPQPAATNHTAAAFVLGVLITLMTLALLNRSGQPATAGPAALAPTAAPAAAITPTRPPPTSTPAALARAIVAYDAPGGTVVGAVEPGRVYTTTARYQASWARLDVQGSGALWVRVAELGATVAPALPDLAPTATPPPTPPAVPSPAPPAAPAAPAAPVPCTQANAPYRTSGEVELNGLVVGTYRVWNCESEAALLRRAAQAEEQIRANVQATQTAQAQPPRERAEPTGPNEPPH